MFSQRMAHTRKRVLLLLTALLIVGYILTRPEMGTEEGLPTLASPYRPVKSGHVEPEGVAFSSLKALGLAHLVSGQRHRLLIIGGASQIGQALVPRLGDNYEVYVSDSPPRPHSLPISPHVHYYRSSAASIKALLDRYEFTGIIHLGAVAHAEWCEVDVRVCGETGVGRIDDLLTALQGNRRRRWWKGGRSATWIVLGSGVDVYPETEAEISAVGRGMLENEQALRRFVESTQLTFDSAGAPSAGSIVRLSTVYGYACDIALPDSFVHSLVSNSIVSAHSQFDSDLAPLDLLHVDDALDGLLSVIQRHRDIPMDGRVEEYDLVAGRRTDRRELVKTIRQLTASRGSLKDIGSDRAMQGTWRDYSPSMAGNVLGWKAQYDLTSGLQANIDTMLRATSDWTLDYISANCPTSTIPDTPRDPSFFASNNNNHDLAELDGCTVNIGFDRAGFLDYVKCPAKGNETRCKVDNQYVKSYNWDASVFVIRRQQGVTGKKRARQVRVRFEEERGRGLLGMRHGDPSWDLLQTDREGQAAFDLEVSENGSYIRFMLPGTTTQLAATPNAHANATIFKLEPARAFDARLNVLCCPLNGGWPLLQDDYESADIHFGSTGQIPFNSSRRTQTCRRAEEAYHQAQTQLKPSNLLSKLSNMSKKPDEWVMKSLPPCWNDCSSPTVCVYTGSCRCIPAECPSIRPNPFLQDSPFLPFAQEDTRPKTKSKSQLGIHSGYSDTLINDVSKANWFDLLTPSSRAYLSKNARFPSVHVVDGYPGQAEIEAAPCHKLQEKHCFSADNIMYRAMRHLSVSAEEAEFVVLPVYQHCESTNFLLHDVMHYAMEHAPGVKTGEKKVALVLTHDWGICIAFAWEVWSARNAQTLFPDWILNNVLVWAVMGDADSPCYRPQQDVVISPRTCQTPNLRETFGDLEHVMPAAERPRLVAWAGTYWGTGKSERLRLTCGRGGAGEKELVSGRGAQSSWGGKDYMKELGSARFCPQPRGIAGWSPRVNDAIYAGCIPVLTAEGTHYPFLTLLDWTKFSVRLHPTDLDRIEDILGAIPLSQVEEMQRNLMLIREGFLYASDENPEEELDRRGPMFWALHEAGMKLGVEFPVA